MNIYQELYQVYHLIAKQVEARIIEGTFDLISTGQYTHNIEINGVNFEIWMANNPEQTEIYAMQHENSTPNSLKAVTMPVKIAFEDPQAVRATLLNTLPVNVEALKQEKQEQINKLQAELLALEEITHEQL